MKFTIGFEKEDKKQLYSYFDDIINRNVWSEGIYVKKFEEQWAEYCGTKYAVAFNSWYGAAMAALNFIHWTYDYEYIDSFVACPSNTFMATPLAIKNSGASIEFADCNVSDLCLSYKSLLDITDTIYRVWRVRRVIGCFIVHIGGHISYDIEKIAELCRANDIFLIEDCAHSHGASYKGKRAGSFGDCGVYSFYATKTVTTGEGGMLVTDNQSLAEYARKYRNYGKFDYVVSGGNYRMSEFTAAIGCVQTARLDDIVAWKNDYVNRNYKGKYDLLSFPEDMTSGYYKCITRTEIPGSTGKVYDTPCHKIMDVSRSLPNTDFIAANHWCLPVYYKGEDR